MPPAPRRNRTLPYPLEALTNPQERIANQAKRHSPPYVVIKKIQQTVGEDAQAKLLKGKKPLTYDKAGFAGMVTKTLNRFELHALKVDPGAATKLQELDDGVLATQFNPETVEQTLKITWNEIEIPGLPYRPQHYGGTENATIKFDLRFDARAAARSYSELSKCADAVAKARAFLVALSAPVGGSGGSQQQAIADGSPPRVLAFWQGYMSITGYVHQISIKDTDWISIAGLGGVRLAAFSATIELKEARDQRFYFADTVTPPKEGALLVTPPKANRDESDPNRG